MKTAAATFILAASLGFAPLALGQAGRSQVASDGWVPVKHLRFTDEDVRGGLQGPEGERIEVVERAPQPCLIELRQGFEAEVVKTMEDR